MTISAVTVAAIGVAAVPTSRTPGVPIPIVAGHDLEVRHLQAGIDGGAERELAVDRDRVGDRGRVIDRDRVAQHDADHMIGGRDLPALPRRRGWTSCRSAPSAPAAGRCPGKNRGCPSGSATAASGVERDLGGGGPAAAASAPCTCGAAGASGSLDDAAGTSLDAGTSGGDEKSSAHPARSPRSGTRPQVGCSPSERPEIVVRRLCAGPAALDADHQTQPRFGTVAGGERSRASGRGVPDLCQRREQRQRAAISRADRHERRRRFGARIVRLAGKEAELQPGDRIAVDSPAREAKAARPVEGIRQIVLFPSAR